MLEIKMQSSQHKSFKIRYIRILHISSFHISNIVLIQILEEENIDVRNRR